MPTTPGYHNDQAAAAFFRNVDRLLRFNDLEAYAQRLEVALADTERLLREERSARHEAQRRLAAKEAENQFKVCTVRLLLKLPPSLQPFAGRLARFFWPGFSEA